MTNERFHALDFVRACALLAGIVLHASMSFLPGFREVNWPLSDNSTSAGLGILYFVIHLFRMSLFFIIAGFFARVLHQRLGTRSFINNRLKRIGLPLVAFYLLVMPLTVIAIIWGARQLGIQGPPKMEVPLPVIGPPVPWGHLWFLYTLLIIYALVLMLRSLVVHFDSNNVLRETIDKLFTASIKYLVGPLLLTAPLALSLYTSSWWVQWQGVPSPIIGLIPNLPALFAYGSAFLVGWYLHRQQNCLQLFAKNWFYYFVAALVATGIALSIVGITPRLVVIELGDVKRAVYALAYCFALWCWCFAAIGISVRYFRMAHRRWRYLADASYWMYLIHLPIVWLLQAWMLSWQLPWTLKLLLTLIITFVVLLTSYDYLIRSTFMGTFLNGRRFSKN